MHYALYTTSIHFTHTLQRRLHQVHIVIYTAPLYTIHCALCTIHCTLYTVLTGDCLSKRLCPTGHWVNQKDYDGGCAQSWTLVYNDTGSILPYVAGTLGVWTLFDYIGEPVSYRRKAVRGRGAPCWPQVSSSYGAFDLAGFVKPGDVRLRCTLHAVHYALYAVHYTLYTVHFTLYTMPYALNTTSIHFTHTPCTMPYTLLVYTLLKPYALCPMHDTQLRSTIGRGGCVT
jgi:hypothetical protein